MLALALLAAAAAADAPAPPRGEVVEQARASVRIISGARVSAEEVPEEAVVREARVERADGSQSTARLVEFP